MSKSSAPLARRFGPLLIAIAAFLVTTVFSRDAGAQAAKTPPAAVKAVADQRLSIATAAGTGTLALYLSHDWSKPLPGVTRAVIVVHGIRRNANDYRASAEKAAAAADAGATTLLITPQFLSDIDVETHDLASDMLRWRRVGWEGGGDAIGPAPISSFSAMDAVLDRLADRVLFPDLKTVVVSGHSGGGQVVQRYAVLGRGEQRLLAAGIAVRYVVANPSSYVYFNTDRPDGNGGFKPFDATSCPGFNLWKYGMSELPHYAGKAEPAAVESAYVRRDVVYLLGTADIDPNHPALDKSCMAEAEGPFRLARGQSYVKYLRARHPSGLHHSVKLVPGIGHDGLGMLTSVCGLSALFDRPGCPASE